MSRVSAVIAVALALAGCAEHAARAEEPLALDVVAVVRRDTEVEREYVCQIRAIQHIEVRALETGYLQETYVGEGELVEEGARLFQILPVVYRAELDVALAERRSAEINYANTRLLSDRDVVSPAELALAEADLTRRTAAASLARSHLDFTTLEAPFAGIVGRLEVRRGSLVEEGDVLTVLSDNSEMWVYFNVSEGEYLAYRAEHEVGDPVPVRLRMANGEMFGHDGVIQTIEADFNNSTGTIAFRAGFPNPEGLLRHGETGTVLLTNALPGSLLVPQAAIYRVLDHEFVFVLDEDGTAHSREIHVRRELDHLDVVESGLEEGDRVLVEGLRRVHDGDHVEARRRELDDLVEELTRLHAE